MKKPFVISICINYKRNYIFSLREPFKSKNLWEGQTYRVVLDTLATLKYVHRARRNNFPRERNALSIYMGIYFFAYSIVGLYYMLVVYACCEKCSDWLRYGNTFWAEFIYNYSGREIALYCKNKSFTMHGHLFLNS